MQKSVELERDIVSCAFKGYCKRCAETRLDQGKMEAEEGCGPESEGEMLVPGPDNRRNW